MRECIRARDIPPEIKKQLPEIDGEIMKQRYCTCCPFYAGSVEGTKRCMARICAWDDDREMLHPALLQMYGRAVAKMNKAEQTFQERKKIVRILEKLKIEEEQEQKRKNDKCFQCVYRRSGPCIGICYAELEDSIRKKEKKNHEQSDDFGETGEGSQL